MNEFENQDKQDITESTAGARIVLATSNMIRAKAASGGVSFHCGDDMAQALTGLALHHIRRLGSEGLNIDVTKYDHLNPGQQRMTIGNVMRNMIRRDGTLVERFNEVLVVVQAEAEREAAELREAAARSRAEREENKAKQAAEKAARAEARAEAKAKRKAEKQAEKDAREANKAAAAAEKQAKKAADAAQKQAEKQAREEARAAERAAKEKERADKKAEREAEKQARAEARAAERAAKELAKAETE